jgi:hypothetical protein
MLLRYWREMRSNRPAEGRRARAKVRPGLENLEDRTVPSLFGPGPVVVTGQSPEAVVVGDFNEDGHPDFAVAAVGPNSQVNGSVTVHINNGTGTSFHPPTSGPASYSAGRFPSSLVAADFNKDGHLDLAAGNEGDHNVTVLLGNGDGSFRSDPGSPFDALGTDPVSLAVADFDSDGNLDLGLANAGTPNVGFLRGNGGGSFSFANTFTFFPHPSQVVAGDFTGDNRPDMAVLNASPTNSVELVVRRNDNSGWDVGPSTTVAGSPVGLAAADVNGDGKLDVLTLHNLTDSVGVLLGTGAGRFAPEVPYQVGQVPYTMTLADFNADGHLDLGVVGNHGVSVLLGNGSGGFIPVGGSPFPGAAISTGIAAGDFNGDGALDLVHLDFTNAQALVLINQSNLLQLPPPSSSFQDVTPLVQVKAATLAGSPSGKHLRQRLTLRNTNSQAITGTLWLVLDGLPRGVRVKRMAGRTTSEGTPGSPYVAVSLPGGVFNPGQRVRLLLDFVNPRGKKIHYTPRFLEGVGTL